MRTLFIILCIPFAGFSQLLKDADRDYAMLDYSSAITGYEKYISKSKDNNLNLDIVSNLANSYYYIKEYEKARKYYTQLYSVQGDNMEESSFIRFVNTVKSAGDYQRADALFNSYYAKNAQKIKTYNYQKRKLDSLSSEYNTVVNLSINSNKSDFGITLYDKEAIFSSSRAETDKASAETAYLSLYKAVRNPNNGQLSNPQQFLTNLNSPFNDATLVFSQDKSTVFFSRNYLTRKDKLDAPNGEVSNVMIMKGRIQGDALVDVAPLSFNSKKYNCSHPFVSPDGKLLFFVSDMPGGYGESDIYVVDLYNDGSTGEPMNLGPMINTPGAEMFPSIAGDTLFFSSDFHYGFGGLDIFHSKMAGKTNYSVPENLGEPINSTADDFSFIRLDNRTGYFSSDRKGGKGSDDLYWFDMVELQQFVAYSGLVLTKGDDAPVSNANIQVFDPFGELITEFQSDDNGKYDVELPCNSQLKLVYSKPDYSTESVHVSTPEKAGDSPDNNVRLTSFSSLIEKDGNMEKIKIDPIYFDYSKWDVTPQAEIELSKILYAMQTFPNIRIKIESHTDSRGSDSYNLKLSDNRAKSTMAYLVSKGIDPSRIESATGYGETRLKNNCKNGVKCSEEEHFINRRSDFIVISK